MSQTPAPTPAAPCCSAPLRSTLAIFLRVALGALFIFSGLMKLGIVDLSKIDASLQPLTPRDFGTSVHAFRLGLSDDLKSLLAYTLPWAEVIAGVCLLLGIMARSAALIVAIMMLGFIAGIVSLLIRGIDLNCPCFGSFKLFCTGPLGVCHIIRNSVFFLMAAAVVALGPGPLALGGRCGSSRC